MYESIVSEIKHQVADVVTIGNLSLSREYVKSLRQDTEAVRLIEGD